MVDQLQSNVVIFLQTLNKAVVDLAVQTGILLKDIGGTDHKNEQKIKDNNWEERSKSVDVTEKEKKKYAEIFKNLNLTENVTKLSKSFNKFDKSVSTFLKTSNEQLETSRKINAELQTNLKSLQTTATTAKTEQPEEKPKKIETNYNVKNPTIENLNKNVGIIATILNKQYIDQQKKFDVLSRDEQSTKNIPPIIPKTLPVVSKEEKNKESSGGFLSILGNIIKTVIIGAIGAWILKNPEKAMQILKDAWDFMKKVGGMIWEGIKFLWPYIQQLPGMIWEGIKFLQPYFEKFVKILGGVVDFLGPKVSGAILVLLTAFKLFGGSITGLVWKLTKLLGGVVWKGAELSGRLLTRGAVQGAERAAVQGAERAAVQGAERAAVQGAERAAGKTLLRSAGKALGAVGTVALAGMEYSERVKSGQTQTQAIAGTAGTTGGALAGAAAGAAIGSVVPVVGTLIGGLIGGIAGSWLGSKVADKITGAADNIANAAENAVDTTKKSKDEINDKLKDVEKDTSLPDIDNNFTSAYKEITDKLLEVNNDHLHISKLQLNELTSNGVKLDRIIEGLKNVSLNNVNLNTPQQSKQSSYMSTKIASTKLAASVPINGIVYPMGGIA